MNTPEDPFPLPILYVTFRRVPPLCFCLLSFSRSLSFPIAFHRAHFCFHLLQRPSSSNISYSTLLLSQRISVGFIQILYNNRFDALLTLTLVGSCTNFFLGFSKPSAVFTGYVIDLCSRFSLLIPSNIATLIQWSSTDTNMMAGRHRHSKAPRTVCTYAIFYICRS